MVFVCVCVCGVCVCVCVVCVFVWLCCTYGFLHSIVFDGCVKFSLSSAKHSATKNHNHAGRVAVLYRVFNCLF